MTNGAPTPLAQHEAVEARQAAGIAAMLERGVDVDTIAAAHGCTRARVQAVAATADMAVLAVPAPRPASEKRSPRRTGGPHPSWDTLLNRARRIDDPRIAAQVDHILSDLADLIAEVRIHDEREKAARALVEADRRAELLRRSYTARHPGRRRTDPAVTP